MIVKEFLVLPTRIDEDLKMSQRMLSVCFLGLAVIGGCKTESEKAAIPAPKPSTGTVARLVDTTCDYLPTALDIAAFLEVTGAAKAKIVTDKICAAVEKARAKRLADLKAKAPVATRDAVVLPAGTALTVFVDGKRIRGATTKIAVK